MKPRVSGLSIIGLLFVLGIALLGVYGIYVWRSNLQKPAPKPPVIIGEVKFTPTPSPTAVPTPTPAPVQPTPVPGIPQTPVTDGIFPQTGPADTALLLLGGVAVALAGRYAFLSLQLKKAAAQASRRILG